jgi:hypothetical protein
MRIKGLTRRFGAIAVRTVYTLDAPPVADARLFYSAFEDGYASTAKTTRGCANTPSISCCVGGNFERHNSSYRTIPLCIPTTRVALSGLAVRPEETQPFKGRAESPGSA